MKKKNNILLIFNPHAGEKREIVGKKSNFTIDEIKSLLKKYYLNFDYVKTKGPGDAKKLAKSASKKGYEIVLAAGGDGTINEVANGLVGSNVVLGIIPLGSFMNIAKMMAIPNQLEQAIEIIKINRVIKVDLGSVIRIKGKSLSQPYYFLETSGIGLDAKFQKYFDNIEKKHYAEILPMFRTLFKFKNFLVTIQTDDKTIESKANLVVVANGPLTGASLRMAPGAKLNNHNLTVVIYNMSWWGTMKYFFRLLFNQHVDRRHIRILESKTANITTNQPVLVHADATLFGETPVSYRINSSCLKIICGFPESKKRAGFI